MDGLIENHLEDEKYCNNIIKMIKQKTLPKRIKTKLSILKPKKLTHLNQDKKTKPVFFLLLNFYYSMIRSTEASAKNLRMHDEIII